MWLKKGKLFEVNNYINNQLKSHASIPFALHIEEDLFRIYFSSRNEKGQSLPFYIDAKVSNGNIDIIGQVQGSILDLGELGTFDDSGIMPSCLVRVGGRIYMYYIGWNPQVTVSYRLSIGLAVSDDDGKTFKKVSEAPILDRDLNEPFFNTAPYVIKENDVWKMWYISCTKWQIINDYPEPSYHIKYAESKDGIHWVKEQIICLDYDEKAKALGRPCVIEEEGAYKMYFSYRDIIDYRIKRGKGYQIGLAESKDGILWEKKYEKTGISLSEEGWDSKMMEYCHVFDYKGYRYMLYNGNDFGKEGFGYAIIDKN